jgi:molybdopterin molybdotransferase
VEFLTSITPAEALTLIMSFPVAPLGGEEVSLEQALDRVLAADITAQEDIPPFPRSLVDGYAVRAKDTYGAREGTPAFIQVRGEVLVGEAVEKQVGDGESFYVATGAMIPGGADGAVMVEYTRQAGAAIEVTRTVRRGENICFTGEDVRKGQVVLEKGQVISPFDLGVLAALGVTRIPVCRQPVAGLISSGNEIIPVDGVLEAGKVRDINTHTVSSLIKRQGCLVRFAGIARDTVDDITSRLSALRECDAILLSGGSSKGQSDFMTTAIERLGGKVLFHGLNIKPGKPTVFAALWGKPVFGLPGHPVSCAMVVMRFVQPLLARMKGERRPGLPCTMWGTLTTNIPSAYGVEEYVRVSVEKRAGLAPLVTPIFAKSSVISTLSKADGYVVVQEGQEGIEAGVEVEVVPLG